MDMADILPAERDLFHEEREAAKIAHAHARAIHTAQQPYITPQEDAALRSIRFVKDFFAQIEPRTYCNHKNSVPWETIGLSLRFFMGDIRCADKSDTRRARYKGKQLGLWPSQLTSEIELTPDLCTALGQWISSVIHISEIQEDGVSTYAITGFRWKRRGGNIITSLSILRSIQLLLRMAEICREREQAHQDTHP